MSGYEEIEPDFYRNGGENEEKYSILFDKLITETADAWLLDIDGVETWFPKSLCKIEDNHITMPYWLAEERDLI